MKKLVIFAVILIALAVAGAVEAQTAAPEEGWAPEYGPGFRTGGPGMMGPGMGRGYGWGHGPDMWGYRYPKRFSQVCQKFLDETVALRKDFFNKRFDYYEALRNPKTSAETLSKLEADMADLNQKIWAKNPHGCWWY